MTPSTSPIGQSGLSPADRPLMRDHVLSVLVDAIRAETYKAGDRLPSERELAAELGVSRVIVSEAIDMLEESGAVTSRRGRGGGTFVVAADKLPAGPRRIRAGDRRQLMGWLLEAREMVEVAVLTAASQRAHIDDIRDLRRLHEEMAGLLDSPMAYAEAAMRFNLRVAAASGNPVLIDVVRLLVNEQAAVRLELDDPSRAQLTDSLASHRRILDAMTDGNPSEILAAVANHMRNIRAIYIGDDEKVVRGTPPQYSLLSFLMAGDRA